MKMAYSTPNSQLSLQGRALRLLSQREHSRQELERKLAPHLQDGDNLAELLDRLEARGFISAARTAQSVINRRGHRLGTTRVAQELRNKGLDNATVHEATLQLRATEHSRAWNVWQQKFGTLPTTPQERIRQMRFLANRGFASDVVTQVVRGQPPSDMQE